LLTAEVRETLRQRRAANTPEWNNFVSWIQPYSTTDPKAYHAFLARDFGLYYQITEDEAYGRRALTFLLQTLKTTEAGMSITSATAGSTTKLTMAGDHGLAVGDVLQIAGAVGQWTVLNGERRVVEVSSTRGVTVNADTSGAVEPFAASAATAIAVSRPTAISRNLNTFRWTIGGPMIEAYDFVYQLTDLETRNALTRYFSDVLVSQIDRYDGSPTFSRVIGNLFAGQLAGVAAITAVLAGDWGPAQGRFDQNREVFLLFAAPGWNDGVGRGGGGPEGVQYNPSTLQYYLDFLETVLSASGEDLTGAIPNFTHDVLKFYLHSTSPTGKPVNQARAKYTQYEPYPYGDAEESSRGQFNHVTRQFMLQLQNLLRRSGDPTATSQLQYWLENIQPVFYPNGTLQEKAFTELMYVSPDDRGNGIDWRISYPRSYLAEGLGLVIGRSDWSSDATWVGFQSGPEGNNHLHGHANQFQIYRKGKWLTSEAVGYGTSFVPSPMHNTLTLNGHSSMASGIYSGRSTGQGRISRFEEAADGSYLYAQGDAAGVYQFTGYRIYPDVSQFVRDFLYIRPDIVVVADRVTYPDRHPIEGANPIVPSVWSIHSAGEPSIEGNRINIVNQDQVLYATAVHPADPLLLVRDNNRLYVTKVAKGNPTRITMDGPHQLAVNRPLKLSGATGAWEILNGDWTVSQVSSTDKTQLTIPVDTSSIAEDFIGQKIDAGRRSTETIKTYRVDVSGRAITLQDQFLFVMQAADQGQPPLQVKSLPGSSLHSAQFDGYVVSAPINEVSAGQSFSYVFDGSNRVKHILMGMKPATLYRSRLERVDGGVQATITDSNEEGEGVNRSTDQGLLIFSSEANPVQARLVADPPQRWKMVNASYQSAAPGSPEMAGCPMLPSNHIWNTPVDGLPVAANSAAYVEAIGGDRWLHADFGSGDYRGAPIGIPFTVVAGQQRRVPVSFRYSEQSDPGPYPIPEDVPIEGGEQGKGDRHVLVLDKKQCKLYELFSAYPQADGSWKAGSGAVFDLRSNALRPEGWTSADAAGLAILPGLVRYEEVSAGEIGHALRFTARRTQKAHAWPARHDASTLTGSNYPPMGQRFRLKADYDIDGFSPESQVILRALKKYGMFLADNGSPWFLSGAPDARWDNGALRELHRVTGSDFEAVDQSSLMVSEESAEAAVRTRPGLSRI
jgi:hypothetical protein